MKIIFVDIETTGLDFNVHVPIEICVSITNPEHDDGVVSTYTSLIRCKDKDLKFADAEAFEVNGLLNEAAFCSKTIEHIADELQEFFIKNKVNAKNSVFLCQNPSFDRAFFHMILCPETAESMNLPYHWLDLASMYMMYHHRVHKELPKVSFLSKDKIAGLLQLPIESKPHRAENGVQHLMLCFNTILQRQSDEQ